MFRVPINPKPYPLNPNPPRVIVHVCLPRHRPVCMGVFTPLLVLRSGHGSGTHQGGTDGVDSNSGFEEVDAADDRHARVCKSSVLHR